MLKKIFLRFKIIFKAIKINNFRVVNFNLENIIHFLFKIAFWVFKINNKIFNKT